MQISLAGAELASGWPEGGGVYAWVKKAFGEKGGFVAIFCDWSNNLVWFPTALTFIASTLAFAITTDLANNPVCSAGKQGNISKKRWHCHRNISCGEPVRRLNTSTTRGIVPVAGQDPKRFISAYIYHPIPDLRLSPFEEGVYG